jgi:REP-associated tyrosine transposase
MNEKPRPVLAYHVTFGTYGFWLPNDPRGSGSTWVRTSHLRPFGRAQKNLSRRSVAGNPHDRRQRDAAKQALELPPVVFSGQQTLSVGTGFAQQVRTSGYVIHACSILPKHVHMVIRWHTYKVERVVGLLKQAATERLLRDGLHPFAELRGGGWITAVRLGGAGVEGVSVHRRGNSPEGEVC